MDSDDFEYKTENFAILGAAMEVSNILGHGLKEKPYENAIVVEFGLQSIPYVQQPRFTIDYKGTNVGDYIPDLIAYDKIVVDTKVIDQITDNEIGQMLNYLAITKMKVGLIINFKHPKLEWKRVVRTNS
ncbi:hypothetical protein VDG1235_3432 [Verrucomicrobiia bacterium DG1235]|nr:hypothetical protein VDG1235_3432 [Verrucomicrobiae bacterium DG1235]